MTPSLALWNAVSAALAFLGSGPLRMIRAAMQVPLLAASCMARSDVRKKILNELGSIRSGCGQLTHLIKSWHL